MAFDAPLASSSEATLALRLQLLANGYEPIPVVGPEAPGKSAGKRPDLKGWQSVALTPDVIRGWHKGPQRGSMNTGLRCGELIGLDLDIPDHRLAAELGVLAGRMLGTSPLRRVGKAPKAMLCYRSPEPISKMETPELFLPAGTKCQVEVLAKGQQFVAYGIHPDTLAEYEWPEAGPDVVPLVELPAVSPAALRAFLAAAEAVIREAGGATERERQGTAAASRPAPLSSRSPISASAKSAPASRKGAGGSEFFRAVNRRALDDIGAWLPSLFPAARFQPGTGAWRVPAASLGRPDLEEDLSIHPQHGGQDFGTRESCSPIDVVMRFAGAPTPQEAAFLLCERMGIAPSDCGWKVARSKPKAEGGGKAPPGGVHTADTPEPTDIELTEHGVAEEFARLHRDDLRYCHHTAAWFVWTGSHWQRNETKLAFSWARRLVTRLNREAEFKTKVATGKAGFAAAVERFAQADETCFAVTSAAWDQDPWLLGTPAGTVDLRTGELREAERRDGLTKVAAVTPAPLARCPLWLQFLQETTAGDAELIGFLKRWCGYCLTGDTREHALLFIYGPGGNGKSVFLSTLAGILGDYARTAPMETFASSGSDRHPTELAMLRGARMVSASETEEGRHWAESRIKQMTGGDLVAARFMRQDYFEYRPQFKLTIVDNHKPTLRSVDDAARRRFNIVPFPHKPAQPDKELPEKLRGEWPGILRWMIDGCLEWQREGITRPEVVHGATDEYFADQDVFGAWAAERCIFDPNLATRPSRLLADFNAWAERNGERTGTRARLRTWVERQPQLRHKTVRGSDYVQGVGLHADADQGRFGGMPQDHEGAQGAQGCP